MGWRTQKSSLDRHTNRKTDRRTALLTYKQTDTDRKTDRQCGRHLRGWNKIQSLIRLGQRSFGGKTN